MGTQNVAFEGTVLFRCLWFQVVVVQACQGVNQESRKRSHPDNSFSETEKQRPPKSEDANHTTESGHTRLHIDARQSNVILLMATKYGDIAVRNHFIPELAKALEQADGQKELYTILQHTISEMRKHKSPMYRYQNPLFLSTATNQLVLPRVSSESDPDSFVCTVL